ncbi:nicotinamide N-methyltransferase [Malassezia cuniculi]|uniref:Nicotinamide N-methyltransferase n=1 Tax=Malassezia cuniculi TaxID=948313 RepID=A0AAF0EQF7_9BASI|nr:nicotinamide N-methyltransferase [Malassezia cuniculi]
MSSPNDSEWALFEEPADFRPPTPPPTTVEQVLVGEDAPLTIRLVGSHPLWGQYVWNAAPTLCEYLDANPDIIRGRAVLELGAAAGIPSIWSARHGAARVVATDYPDPDLMDNLKINISKHAGRVASVQGYIWGSDPAALLAEGGQYDAIFMSDLIFNHQAHGALLDTCDLCLKDDAPALVFFSHHRPHLADRDMAFFALAEQRGYTCTHVGDWRLQPMFPEDPGDEVVRATVHGWIVKRSS